MHLVIVTEDFKIRNVVKRIGSVMGLEHTHLKSLEEINSIDFKSIGFSEFMIFIDTESMDKCDEAVQFFRSHNLKSHFICTGARYQGELLPSIDSAELGQCYLSKESSNFEENLLLQVRTILKECKDEITDNMLSKVPWKSMELRNSFEIKDAIVKIESYCKSLGFGMHTINMLKMVSNEMLCNAVFNYPDLIGKNDLDVRKVNIPLEGKKIVNLKYSYDGRKFNIMCEDHHGSLDFTSLFNTLKRCSESKSKVKMGQMNSSGGIGFYMMLNMLDEMWISVEQNKKTTCIGSLYPPEIHKKGFKKDDMQSFCCIQTG